MQNITRYYKRSIIILNFCSFYFISNDQLYTARVFKNVFNNDMPNSVYFYKEEK